MHTQYEIYRRKRVLMASLMIFVLIPATMAFGVVVLDQNMYMLISLLVVIYTLIPFFMVFEARKPKAREIVLIAMMAALTTVLHIFLLLIENPALDAGFHERYAFDQKSSEP